MDDSNQIEVPPSFVALFASRYGQKLTEPMSVVRQRYELCEDLAQMLVDNASAAQFKTGGSEREVLQTILAALSQPDSAVQPMEATWVVTRLAELLGWQPPDAPDAEAG